jgi:dipeptidase
MTSHTCDSHEGHTWLVVVPPKNHAPGSQCAIYKNTDHWEAIDTPKKEIVGYIPQVPHTYGYIYGFYATMNEHQLALGESTFEGRKELVSKNGILNCYELSRLIMERCKTAREAIDLIDDLTQKYGYNDLGECLTLADTKEVWHIEIVGPGKDKKGAVWAARKIPDDHVGVCANSSRIGELDLNYPGYCKASKNVYQVAIENGWWDPGSGKPFRFWHAYNPDGRVEFACTRREWRVLSLLSPSLKLEANANEFPFTVQPEKKVSHATIMEMFRDTFEDTEFDMTKFMIMPDPKDKTKLTKSPYANPFLHYDEMFLHRINGGWSRLGERPLARAYCVYVHVTQSRDWLPNPMGGVVWVGYANPAMTTYAPLYCGITELPTSYTSDGRNQYSRENAWWAFVRVSKLASKIWGHMRKDVGEVRDKLQKEALDKQADIEKQALELYKQDPQKAIAFLTKYTNEFCKKIVAEYWKLGDMLWVKYQDKM